MGRPIEEYFAEAENFVGNKIARQPGIYGGAPIIAGTRVPVYAILQALDRPAARNLIKHAYPTLTEEDIIAALEFAAKVLEY